jgi:hypothetical protein
MVKVELMVNLRHPVLVRASSSMKSGLGALAQLAEDAAAASRAARTAQDAVSAQGNAAGMVFTLVSIYWDL